MDWEQESDIIIEEIEQVPDNVEVQRDGQVEEPSAEATPLLEESDAGDKEEGRIASSATDQTIDMTHLTLRDRTPTKRKSVDIAAEDMRDCEITPPSPKLRKVAV